jgi:sulfate adenylyltransferase
MMGGGYFTPLAGYMNVADAVSVAETMRPPTACSFPVPVMCLVPDISAIGDAKRIALRDPNMEGEPVLAIMDLENIERSPTSRWR